MLFGISRTWVSLIDLGRVPEVKKYWISVTISGPTVGQLAWKKLAENPSGPGALSGWIESYAKWISSALGNATRYRFVISEIFGVRASATMCCLSPGIFLNRSEK